MKFTNKHFMRLAVLLLIGSMALLLVQPWGWDGKRVIIWDVSIYYTYLPAAFIYQDLGVETSWPVDFEELKLTLNHVHPEQPKLGVLKMSLGMAWLYAPFFGLAHLAASVHPGYPATGYTAPYNAGVALAGMFYSVVGIYLLWLFLIRFVNRKAALLSLTVTVLGTNLVYYMLWEPGMSHGPLFGLVSGLLFLAEVYKEQQMTGQRTPWGLIMLMGFVAGLIVLIRPIWALPTLVLAGFYLYQLRFHISSKQLLILVCFAFAPWVPQLLYWKFTTDNWLFFSYVGERFFWDHSVILSGLFSFRKGWLIYSPLMVFS